MSFLEKEKQHVDGFSPELAVVTHGGGELLAEPLVVRPTSETVINHYFATWVQSHRDLPLMLNLWNNVVRWELRPRLFLRTTEFLWQEGHTAHASYEGAVEETQRMLDVYRQFMEESLAISVVVGEKSPGERFAGADQTFTGEALMRDGRALQMGTSHNLGHNFARAFDIQYLDAGGERRYVATTSWGTSTRMVGAMIMVHGDDHGLRLPPAIAPHQVVVMQLDEESAVAEAAERIEAELRAAGVRTHVDARAHTSFGRRSVDWELKGVPVRIELGARELISGQATLVRRDDRSKRSVPLDGGARAAASLLGEIQQVLFAESRTFREEHTYPVTDFDEFKQRIGDGGLFLAAWSGTEESEQTLGEDTGATIRCIVDAAPPAPTCLITGLPAKHTVLIGRAY
ncbi:MAG TPA: His/Gly/Thr/Pro-type tRNA ligase C-terminal domain-containing protein [Geodermatophilus sp.]|nr:His/Gly/Thr/Pro-type tRNA ligase C-terminal domain-containing protein [Geodermatophilus sp.]